MGCGERALALFPRPNLNAETKIKKPPAKVRGRYIEGEDGHDRVVPVRKDCPLESRALHLILRRWGGLLLLQFLAEGLVAVGYVSFVAFGIEERVGGGL